MRVRLITINLKGMGLGWFEGRFSSLLQGLYPYEPDVICFQESTVREETPVYNQARVVGESLGLKYCAFIPYGNPAEMVTRDQGGIAMVSRWPISDMRSRRIPPGHLGAADERVALFSVLKTDEGELGVINTHLSWRPDESEVRLVQMGIILNEISKYPWGIDEKFVFLGDLNATSDEPAIQVACERLLDVFHTVNPQDPGYTWSVDNPFTQGYHLADRRIDYIFCPRKATIHQCKVILNQAAPIFPSDHFGVFAEVEFSGG